MGLMDLLRRRFGSRDSAPEEGIGEAVGHYRAGRFEDALRSADAMLADAPEVALSWRFRGETLFQLNRYPEAAESFQRAIALGGPGTSDLLMWVALSQANDGRIAEATSTAQQYLASSTPGTPQHEGAKKLLAQLLASSSTG